MAKEKQVIIAVDDVDTIMAIAVFKTLEQVIKLMNDNSKKK